MTSSSLFFFRQSRMPCRTITMRLSRASKCGSHNTGAIGSFSSDSRITCERGLGPLWNLRGEEGAMKGWNRVDEMSIGGKDKTHFKRTSKVDPRIRQHCSTGAKMVSSSWKGFPKPRPWSKCSGNVSLPNILELLTGKNIYQWKIISQQIYYNPPSFHHFMVHGGGFYSLFRYGIK